MSRPGTVLVMVLVVSVLAATVAAGLVFAARAERQLSIVRDRGEQARAAAMSGIHAAMTVLAAAPDEPDLWRDNPDLFRDRLVFDDGGERWYVTLYAHRPEDPIEPRYGVSDEASRLNLNAIADDVLYAMLPDRIEAADAILDWRDRDDETRSEGAEADYYAGLDLPYRPRNGPLRTLDEALMARAVGAAVLYGEDANLNGRLEPNESDGDDTFPPDSRDDHLDRGLRGLVTVWSREPNVDSLGDPRVRLNGPTEKLEDIGLSPGTLEFLDIARKVGRKWEHPSDVVGASVEVPEDGVKGYEQLQPGDVVECVLAEGDLDLLLDHTTTSGKKFLTGLVNVNTASAEVLAHVPGLGPEAAADVVAARADLDPAFRTTPAWLWTEGLVSDAEFRKAAPHLTTRSRQFRVQAVGYGLPCRQFRVLEAVIDLADGPPRIVYLRDLTRLGMPVPIDLETLDQRG